MQPVTPIIIPSFEPDSRLIDVVCGLKNIENAPVIIVNDGSGPSYAGIFEKLKSDHEIVVLEHDRNRGKGRALKTAFCYCLQNYQHILGCVTADSDGQHTPRDIKKVISALNNNPESLILGVRDFDSPNVPDKSRFGNNLTKKVFRRLFNADLTDTQTGLRGITAKHMKAFMKVSGDRFEYETNMLIKAIKNRINITEVPIETVYDDKLNHSTHFRPVVDSVKIYSLFIGVFIKFALSAASSSILDIGLFQLFCFLLRNVDIGVGYVVLSTVMARILSAAYNFTINYKYVFKSDSNKLSSLLKYTLLAVFIMVSSGLLTSMLFPILGVKYEFLAKIPVDVVLFIFSYLVQKKFVYS